MQKIIINLVVIFFSIGINAEQKYIGFNDPESVAEGPDGAGLAQIRPADRRGPAAAHRRRAAPALGLRPCADFGGCGLGDPAPHHAGL